MGSWRRTRPGVRVRLRELAGRQSCSKGRARIQSSPVGGPCCRAPDLSGPAVAGPWTRFRPRAEAEPASKARRSAALAAERPTLRVRRSPGRGLDFGPGWRPSPHPKLAGRRPLLQSARPVGSGGRRTVDSIPAPGGGRSGGGRARFGGSRGFLLSVRRRPFARVGEDAPLASGPEILTMWG